MVPNGNRIMANAKLHFQLIAAVIASTVAHLGGTVSGATHTFELTTLLDSSDVPAPSDPTLLTLYFESTFAGDEVITTAGGGFQEIIGMYRTTPDTSSIEAIFETPALSPTTGNLIEGLVFPSGDSSNLFTTLGSINNAGTAIVEIAKYNGSTNNLTALVARDEPFPGRTTIVDSFQVPEYAVSGGSVAYHAWTNIGLVNEREGIFLSPANGGSTITLVDTTFDVPGTIGPEQFTSFSIGREALDDSVLTFVGSHEENGETVNGIYTVTPGGLPNLVLRDGDPLPSTVLGPDYGLFGMPANDGGDIVFRASEFVFPADQPTEGLFAILDGTTTLIADSSTPLPQTPGETFSRFFVNNVISAAYSIDDKRVLFGAIGSDNSEGIYLYDEGDISLVIQEGDTIDSLSTFLVNVYPNSLRGNQIVMDMIVFDDEFAEGRVVLAEFDTAAATADFNNDGSVDQLDLAQWRGDYARNGDSDADADGDTDGGDFLGWQQQRQLSAIAAYSVPEPTSAALAAVACLAICLRTRRARY